MLHPSPTRLAAWLSHLTLAIASSSSSSSSATCSIRQLYQFHSDSDIFLENIAVRPTGQLLLTTVSHPWIYTFDPASSSSSSSSDQQADPTPRILAAFPEGNGCTGIAETGQPDVFAVVCATHDPSALSARDNVLFTLDLRGVDAAAADGGAGEPIVRQVTEVVRGGGRMLWNGMTTTTTTTTAAPNGRVLMAESLGGTVWWADVASGEYGVAIEDPLFKPGGILPLGINGLRIRGRDLYFANSGVGFFGRISTDGKGNAIGKAERLVDPPPGLRTFDDFAVDGEGTMWVATHDDAVTVMTADGERWVIRDVNGTSFMAPTSAAMGRGSAEEERTVYVVTGGMGGMLHGSGRQGQIIAIRN